MKTFTQCDLVWKVVMPLSIKKFKFYAKWSPNWEAPYKIVKILSSNPYLIIKVNGGDLIMRINGKHEEI